MASVNWKRIVPTINAVSKAATSLAFSEKERSFLVQLIPLSPHGPQKYRLSGIGLQLFAPVQNMHHVRIVGLWQVFLIPYSLI